MIVRSAQRDGNYGFYDSPRYSSGYTTLFNSIGFITETHMLKPYKPRVKSTYAFLMSMVETANKKGDKIRAKRKVAKEATKTQTEFHLHWEIDKEKATQISFNGFEADTLMSKVTGLPRLFYDRNKPFTRNINYYNTYHPVATVSKAKAYIIPKGWEKVIDLLALNQVEIKQLKKDSLITVTAYTINEYDTNKQPYESHYLHKETSVNKKTEQIQFLAGDYVIQLNQEANRFIIEVLEPEAVDSYFNWNYFDGILQQKEWFSSYVFEDKAAEILKENPALKLELDSIKETNQEFAQSSFKQLYHIYKQTPHYEPSHMRYPVFRLE